MWKVEERKLCVFVCVLRGGGGDNALICFRETIILTTASFPLFRTTWHRPTQEHLAAVNTVCWAVFRVAGAVNAVLRVLKHPHSPTTAPFPCSLFV